MATLLAQVLPLHLSTQVYSSDVETLSKILAKFVERLHDSPVAVREVAAAHAVAALGKQRQFVATGAISRSGNGGKDDPLILNLIANETHFRELAHSLGVSILIAVLCSVCLSASHLIVISIMRVVF